MSTADIKKNAEQKMQKSIESLKVDLGKIRTGRAHTGILDHVKVDYYGTPTAITQLASVSLVDARTIAVTPWEKKLVGAVEKAIRDSDLGLNPATQGETVRVPMPPLTEERRRELTKIVKTEGEGARVAIRNLRRDANNAAKELLKTKVIPEDQDRRSQEEIQKLTDRFIAEVDKMLLSKESELMAV
jgi:ribosome recycling factor